jgi:NTE family protein
MTWPCVLAISAIVLLTACSTTRPWINAPIQPNSPPANPLAASPGAGLAHQSSSFAVAVTLSGGGARAAAFGLGVLDELKATRFEWEGRETTLLDAVELISGVSGGSVLASYYAAFGDDVLTRFEGDFLLSDFQKNFVGQLLSPDTLYRLSSPWVGRSNVFAEELNRKVFRGVTFGELRARRTRPQLLVTATDLTTGAPFEFTPEQFALICSDLDGVPLSFAVAASSAVPLLLSPMTLRNYAGSCPQSAQVVASVEGERNAQAHMLYANAQSYLDVRARPYLHLVDGGLTDNLGVRGLLDRSIAGGSLAASFRGVPPHSLRKLVLISVNSERDTAGRIDESDRVPSTAQVLDALVFGTGSRATHETLAVMSDNAQRWMQELAALRGGPESPFAPDAQIHVISVSLRDLRNVELRRRLLQVPTALTILPLQVRELRQAGREVMRESPEFQAVRHSLARPSMATDP